jgi:hypothetical protein
MFCVIFVADAEALAGALSCLNNQVFFETA